MTYTIYSLWRNQSGLLSTESERATLRKCAVFYSILGNADKGSLFDVAIGYLENLMELEESEKEFIDCFFKADFRPELLFDRVTSENLKKHPVVMRTLTMIKERAPGL